MVSVDKVLKLRLQDRGPLSRLLLQGFRRGLKDGRVGGGDGQGDRGEGRGTNGLFDTTFS